ncbi:energy transducer TonB [Pseudocolwellia sp. HL-MZ19]|uniref:energy transducer TonB n=1 Tax=unclassified Pseudocolwellia TaxID=2848178 RepID=UPI003CFB3F79
MKKAFSIISAASIVTFSLFIFMAYLVSSDEVRITESLPPVFVEVNQNKPDTPPRVKVKKLPEPPIAPKPMPKLITAIDKGPGVAVGGVIHIKPPTNTSTIGEIPIAPDHDARPIVRISPKYPIAAARDGIEGWVQLAFDINTLGEVINISVLDSNPKRMFDRAAKQALKKWKYKAKSMNGEFVNQINQTVQLDFNMDQQI